MRVYIYIYIYEDYFLSLPNGVLKNNPSSLPSRKHPFPFRGPSGTRWFWICYPLPAGKRPGNKAGKRPGPWAIALKMWLLILSLPDPLPFPFRAAGKSFWEMLAGVLGSLSPVLDRKTCYWENAFQFAFRFPLASLPGSFRECRFWNCPIFPTSWKTNWVNY